MHSLLKKVVVVGSMVGSVQCAPAAAAAAPVITPAPSVDSLVERQDPDAISLAQILLTAVPQSLRQIAATNLPAVSSILWEEFLDNKRPEWFLELPWDIQNYLIRKFGPQTALPTEAPASSGFDESGCGLSKDQKIGLGVGIPFGLLGAAAMFLACCVLCRRRKKKNVEGSIPPASPGFIPRFAFQEKYENLEHRTPLNRDLNHSTHDVGTAWDDEGIDPTEAGPIQNTYAWNDQGAYSQAGTLAPAAAASAYSTLDNEIEPNNYSNVPVMMMHDPKPVMAPALFHTHSSNRARGKRTSYTSLHSVAEVSEPDEIESPILGRHISQNQSPPRNLMPTPASAQIRRKPVPPSPPLPPLPTSPSPVATSPAAHAASHKLLRQTMPDHSGSSSSGLALTTSSGMSSSSGLGLNAEPTSPISPISNRAPSNPFNYDSYVEDYGPEYHNGYVDVDDGLYGGNTSLSQYPEPRRKSSKTEWPLRNIVGSHQRRKSSPIWERIYEE
ncbi:hypothetical protein N0V90_005351 [Kalmusia sp. IMI 367209]|nr:hypothetical protein N0V90_005351 [Kalmusia sp. IMI 367209]